MRRSILFSVLLVGIALILGISIIIWVEVSLRPTRAEAHDVMQEVVSAQLAPYHDVVRKVDLASLPQKTDLASLGTKVDADLSDLRRDVESDLAEKPSVTNIRDMLNQVSAQVSEERLTRADVQEIIQRALRDVPFSATASDIQRARDAIDRAIEELVRNRERLEQAQTAGQVPAVPPAKAPNAHCPMIDPTRAVSRYR